MDAQGSNIDAESPIALRELEPSPVDDTPIDQSSDSYFPPSKPLHRSTTFLGLGDHGPAYYLTRLQRYSSYAFSIFTVFHITNTSLIPLTTQSIAASDSYLLLTRPYYQSRPFEPLIVVAPLAIHILSGLALRLYRRAEQVRRYGALTPPSSAAAHSASSTTIATAAADTTTNPSRSKRKGITSNWPSISNISKLGYATTILIAGHASINRLLPLVAEGSSANVGLEFVSHGVARHPLVAVVGFSALVCVSVWHIVWGAAKWQGLTPAQAVTGRKSGEDVRLRRKRRWYVINGVAALVSGVWLAGGLGVVGRGGATVGWQAGVYDALYKQIPLVGRWF